MKYLLSVLSLTLMASTSALAGDAKVSFNNIEDYADFTPASGVKDRFQQRKMDDLTSFFNELSGDLPADYTLTVTVQDIDLTGRLEPTFGESTAQYMRVVRSIDYPRMDFSYELRDDSGAVIQQDNVSLQDMSFDLERAWTPRSRSDGLYFEQKMLRDWFDKTFAEYKGSSANQPAESA